MHLTRLHQFARSLLYNATAGGALWWLRKSHIVNYAKHQHSPGGGMTFQTAFPIVWWKFHENPFSRSRERVSHSFGGQKRKTKKTKNKKNNCKTYTHPPPTGRRLRKWDTRIFMPLVHLSICLCVCLCVCLSVCLSLCIPKHCYCDILKTMSQISPNLHQHCTAGQRWTFYILGQKVKGQDHGNIT